MVQFNCAITQEHHEERFIDLDSRTLTAELCGNSNLILYILQEIQMNYRRFGDS